MGDEPVLKTFPSPMGNGLLVKVFDPQSQQFGVSFFGQITPPTDGEGKPDRPLPARGMVVATGPGTLYVQTGERVPMAVEVGDEVLFFDQFSQPIEIGEERLVLLSEEHILVVVSRVTSPVEVDG